MIPKYFSVIWAAIAPAMGNHLWQSTLCLIIAGLLTLILRKNHARARYGLWLAASIKFLIPFSLLIGIGSHLARPRVLPPTEPGFFLAMQEVSQPFTPSARVISPVARSATFPNLDQLIPAILVAMWLCGFAVVLLIWYARWRRISAALREAAPLREGREVEALRRLGHLGGVQAIELLLSPATLEPGIFGIVKPVLVWPKGFSQHLQDAHLEAILTHEVRHVRRRDNLAAAIHMVVEAIFWFHPLVWWLGSRLVEERERACDEEVLAMGSERKVYAESILKTCKFCVESPLACVAGVTDADLKKRMVRIMTERRADKLSFGRKLLLAAIGIAAVAGPLLWGLKGAPQVRAQKTQAGDAPLPSFEVASIKLSRARSPFTIQPALYISGDFCATDRTIGLIESAYGHSDSPLNPGQVSGGPDWIKSEVFDIEAKVEDSLVRGEWKRLSLDEQRNQVLLMLRSLLADRFKLRVRHETKELPVYALVLAKNGPKFAEDNTPSKYWRIEGRGPGKIAAISVAFSWFAGFFSGLPELGGRIVLDKTGLQGRYSFTFQWKPENPAAKGGQSADSTPLSDSSGPSLFTALQEQLGLELVSTKAPVDVLVIDHIERPSEN